MPAMPSKNEVKQVSSERGESMKDRVCIVCGHSLRSHIDEGGGWRCHALGSDAYQCECFLRRGRAKGEISYYDWLKRVKKSEKELEQEMLEYDRQDMESC